MSLVLELCGALIPRACSPRIPKPPSQPARDHPRSNHHLERNTDPEIIRPALSRDFRSDSILRVLVFIELSAVLSHFVKRSLSLRAKRKLRDPRHLRVILLFHQTVPFQLQQ